MEKARRQMDTPKKSAPVIQSGFLQWEDGHSKNSKQAKKPIRLPIQHYNNAHQHICIVALFKIYK